MKEVPGGQADFKIKRFDELPEGLREGKGIAYNKTARRSQDSTKTFAGA